jgi:diguanylate cyclase (GGDEF)-like protein/PAS domain S-box-containing protein
MDDHQKTKAQLIEEITELRRQLIHQADYQQIKIQQKKFFSAAEQNPASIIITDMDGTIEYVNPAFTSLTGFSAEEAIGENPRILKSGHTTAEEYSLLWQTLTAGNPWQGKLCNRKKNDEIYWVSVSISPVKNDEGEITHFVAVEQDSSGRQLAEEQLQQEHLLMRTLIDTIPDQIFAHDRDCRFILNNLSDARVLGIDDPSTLRGKSDLDFYPPEFAERFQANDREVMENDRPIRIDEEPSVSSDGKQRWVSTIKVPFHDNLGNVLGLVGVARDVTAKKIAEDESFHARQMLQMVVDNIPMLVFWKDPNLVYMGCNQAFANHVGLSSPEEIVGKTDYDFSNKDVADYLRGEDLHVIENDTPKLGYEDYTIQPDGSKRWTRLNKIPLHSREGKVIGLLFTSEDITDRIQAEQEIELANEKLIAWVNDLERRNQEAHLIRQMSDLLQVSNERDEYYTIIKEFIPQFFPGTSGALYILSNSRSIVEAVATWGETLQTDQTFAPNECWAIRRAQIYQGGETKPGLNCKHVHKAFSGNYLEVPMMASGEIIGVLHLEQPGDEFSMDNLHDLAHMLADHLSLSFSNLHLRETLRTQSIRDALTGLYNRRYMEEALAREIPRASRKQMPVSIIMLDIDHFKTFNDTNGHEAGDMVLRELGALLQSQVRSEDITCRYGGEEFILIMPESNQETTLLRAEKIRLAVKSMRVEYRKQPLGIVSVSIGVAVYPDHSTTMSGLLKKADEALYLAKRSGRDKVVIADTDITPKKNES